MFCTRVKHSYLVVNKIPWHPIEFHETIGVTQNEKLEIALNSMELLQTLSFPIFIGIRWNLRVTDNGKFITWISMRHEARITNLRNGAGQSTSVYLCLYSMNLFMSSKLENSSFRPIPWNSTLYPWNSMKYWNSQFWWHKRFHGITRNFLNQQRSVVWCWDWKLHSKMVVDRPFCTMSLIENVYL